MAHDPGDVWWGPAPHKAAPSYRPWLIISDTTHPFAHTECIALAMTTQHHAEGITVTTSDWIRGGSKKDASISPWYVITIKYSDFDRQQGTLTERLLTNAIEKLHRLLPIKEIAAT